MGIICLETAAIILLRIYLKIKVFANDELLKSVIGDCKLLFLYLYLSKIDLIYIIFIHPSWLGYYQSDSDYRDVRSKWQ